MHTAEVQQGVLRVGGEVVVGWDAGGGALCLGQLEHDGKPKAQMSRYQQGADIA